jgi:hypothetical protein
MNGNAGGLWPRPGDEDHEKFDPCMQAIRQKKLEQLKTDGIPAKYLAELARVRFTTVKLH